MVFAPFMIKVFTCHADRLSIVTMHGGPFFIPRHLSEIIPIQKGVAQP